MNTRLKLSIAFFFVAFVQLSLSVSDFLSEEDKDAYHRLLTRTSFVGMKNTFYGVESLKLLNHEPSNEYCNSDFKVSDARDLFFVTSIKSKLNCRMEAPKDDLISFDNAKSLEDLYYKVHSAILLQNAKAISNIAASKYTDAVSKTLEFFEDNQDNNYFKALTFELLATLAKHIPKEAKSDIEAFFDANADIFSSADEDENRLFFASDMNSISSLELTTRMVRGVNSLASALKKAPKEVNSEQIEGLAEYFLHQKGEAQNAEEIYFVLQGLTALAENVFYIPLALSLPQKSLSPSAKGEDAYVRVRITDLMGKPVTNVDAFLASAHPVNEKDRPLLSNQQIFTSEKDASSFRLNFLAAKPEPGVYTLIFNVRPKDKKFITLEAEAVSLKVLGTVSVSDAQIVVSDTADPADLVDARKYGLEFPKTSETIEVDGSQHIHLKFKLRSQNSKPLEAHQVFVRLIHVQSGAESTVAAQSSSSKLYSAHLSLEKLATQLGRQSGAYEIHLIVGDSYLQTPLSWKISTLSLKYKGEAIKKSDPFAKKPEIVHQFRVPEARPPKTISFAFTLATIAPFLILFLGFPLQGANLKRFPFTGTGFLYNVGFLVCLGATLALYAFYWLSLNMVQTLTYLFGLSIPTLFFANRALNELAKVKTD